MHDHGQRHGRCLSTTAPLGFDHVDARAFLESYAAIGVTHAQVYRSIERDLEPEAMRSACREAGLIVDSLHGRFGHDLDPSSPDEAHRDACLAVYEAEARLAIRLGAPLVVVHPAAYFHDMHLMPPDEARETERERWPHLEDFARRLALLGEHLGVTYALENLPYNAPAGHDPLRLAGLVREIGSERLVMCFDVGHAHMTGDAPHALERVADVVGYVHVHDNDGAADSHLMPGAGGIDWQRWSEAVLLSDTGAPMMLEVFEPVHAERGTPAYAAWLAGVCGIDQELTW